jgi:protein-tyrosine phosphatase
VGRRLTWPDCHNARDLGGLPHSGGLTRSGLIVRSDNVSYLTPDGVQAMWTFGVTHVIDLRSESEVAKFPSPFASPDYGPEYLSRPLVDDVLAPELAEVPSMSDRYLMMLERRQQGIGGIFNALAQVDGPVVFHCYAGKDRTGLIAAMVLSLAGVHADAIAADYAETDVHLATRYEEWLATAPPERLDALRDELRCPPEWILGALDHLDQRWGGVEAYLLAGGVSPAQVDRLKEKLLSS